MQKYTVNAGLLMATEKDPNRSFVFITTLRKGNKHACKNAWQRVCGTKCKKKL